MIKYIMKSQYEKEQVGYNKESNRNSRNVKYGHWKLDSLGRK